MNPTFNVLLLLLLNPHSKHSYFFGLFIPQPPINLPFSPIQLLTPVQRIHLNSVDARSFHLPSRNTHPCNQSLFRKSHVPDVHYSWVWACCFGQSMACYFTPFPWQLAHLSFMKLLLNGIAFIRFPVPLQNLHFFIPQPPPIELLPTHSQSFVSYK